MLVPGTCVLLALASSLAPSTEARPPPDWSRHFRSAAARKYLVSEKYFINRQAPARCTPRSAAGWSGGPAGALVAAVPAAPLHGHTPGEVTVPALVEVTLSLLQAADSMRLYQEVARSSAVFSADPEAGDQVEAGAELRPVTRSLRPARAPEAARSEASPRHGRAYDTSPWRPIIGGTTRAPAQRQSELASPSSPPSPAPSQSQYSSSRLSKSTRPPRLRPPVSRSLSLWSPVLRLISIPRPGRRGQTSTTQRKTRRKWQHSRCRRDFTIFSHYSEKAPTSVSILKTQKH